MLRHVAVRSAVGNSRIWFQKTDAWRILQARFEVFHVLFADCRLPRKPVELRAKDGRLKFSHAIIESDNSVVIFVREAGAPRVDVALDALHVFQVVGDDRSAFTRADELPRLKA